MEANGAPEQRDDMVLLAVVAEGDTAALCRRHSAWLFARLMRRCNDSDVVVDVVRDTFVTVWKDARRYRDAGEVAGWLWGIAFRGMVSRLRSRRDVVLLPEATAWSCRHRRCRPATAPCCTGAAAGETRSHLGN